MADNTKFYAAGGVGVGALFLYAAVKGKSVLSTTQAAIKGNSPTTGTNLPETQPSSNAIPNAESSAFTGTAPVPTNSSETAFFTAVLVGIGAPPTSANLSSMAHWAQHESIWPGGPGKGGTYNPFNTTLGMPGATNYNSVGVKNYTSATEGVAGTVATLLGSGYSDVVSAFRSGQGLCGRSFAGLSRWSGGGYSSVC